MKIFGTIFKRTSTGEVQEWTIVADGDTTYTLYGRRGGKIVKSAPVKCTPKNVGRANETTGEQQALLEAEAARTLKLKKDYVESLEACEAGETSELIEGGVLPMLAHRFDQHGDKLKYPCFVQPKLDGHRCIGDTTGLWSRTRKLITGVPHITDFVHDFGVNVPLDGELYNHAYRDKFEELTHFIRQSTPEAGCEVVEYHVYDLAVAGMAFRDRLAWLRTLRVTADCPIKLVETREVQDEDELMLAFEDFLSQGYEGAIARNADGLYVNNRSTDLLKIKQFIDSEYKVVGVAEGKGKMAGHGIFLCTTKPGTPDFGVVTAEMAKTIVKANPGVFSAKMKGDHDDLRKYVDDYPTYRGHLLTVKYQGLTCKNGVPRFPVALRIREDV